jgi:hypothetical protein
VTRIGEKGIDTAFVFGKPMVKGHLGDGRGDKRVTLKCILRKYIVTLGYWLQPNQYQRRLLNCFDKTLG